MLQPFFENYSYVEEHTVVSPIYQIFGCPDCINKDNCIHNGRYCAIDADGDKFSGTGKDVLEEYLR